VTEPLCARCAEKLGCERIREERAIVLQIPLVASSPSRRPKNLHEHEHVGEQQKEGQPRGVAALRWRFL